MTQTLEHRYEQAKALFEKHNQAHVFKFWDELNQEQQKGLLDQLDEINVALIDDIFAQSTKTQSGIDPSIQPPADEDVKVLNKDFTKEQQNELFNEGIKLIAEGKVGVLLLAGGQGTRLGFDKPKGMYVIDGLPSKKSLYQIQAERIIRLQQLAEKRFNKKKVTIPWYIMTSPFTEQDTKEFFAQHNYFGLDKNMILFFNQDSVPCLSLDGKIMLESKDTVAFAPNGNGGVYAALARYGMLAHMKQHGIEYIHSYCVDNILVKVAHPAFIAFCAKSNADLGSLVVPKREPHEKVGVFCTKNNAYYVVEYSEITKEMAERLNPKTGTLAFNASNIANFFYTRQFLEQCAEEVKSFCVYHIAKKKIPTVNEQGETVTPAVENGIKLELFNFDICKFAKTVALLQVDRNFEFSPLKNATGSDSPHTCLVDVTRVSIHYLTQAGAIVKEALDPQKNICEISTLVSYQGEDLETIAKGKTFELPVYIQ
jgi:UDP-N-acetylglucosamine/UDP-N-acetylgalactosamine diphosphorylase